MYLEVCVPQEPLTYTYLYSHPHTPIYNNNCKHPQKDSNTFNYYFFFFFFSTKIL
ncbi:hypothetical protein BY458DRAFT_511838, partial [Sporodiniella umbellata]